MSRHLGISTGIAIFSWGQFSRSILVARTHGYLHIQLHMLPLDIHLRIRYYMSAIQGKVAFLQLKMENISCSKL
jgi:hypothetical protein